MTAILELEKEDRVISEFLTSIGPWRDCIVIGGGYALIIYKLYLADQELKNPPVGTRDIDSLIPRRVPEVSKKNLAKHLEEAGYVQVFKDCDHPASEAYVKEINGLDIEIEFLTDSATRTNQGKNVRIAGVVAQPLSYLTLSLQTTMKFKTHTGKIGSVVSPGAWMFHKGLTFTKRKSISKTHKDLYGIWYVSTQLGVFSEDAIIELKMLAQHHPKWFKTLRENLHNWTESAAPIDWSRLETQDPLGNLKRLNFERIIQRLVSSP